MGACKETEFYRTTKPSICKILHGKIAESWAQVSYF